MNSFVNTAILLPILIALSEALFTFFIPGQLGNSDNARHVNKDSIKYLLIIDSCYCIKNNNECIVLNSDETILVLHANQ